MNRIKKPVKYHGISLPCPLIEEIKKYIKDKPEYRSVADFTKQASREKMGTPRPCGTEVKIIPLKRRVHKSGNSMVFALPSQLAKMCNIRGGTIMEITPIDFDKGQFLVQKCNNCII